MVVGALCYMNAFIRIKDLGTGEDHLSRMLNSLGGIVHPPTQSELQTWVFLRAIYKMLLLFKIIGTAEKNSPRMKHGGGSIKM